MHKVLGFMTVWTMLCLKMLVIQLVIWYIFYSASGQHCDVWASQFLFFHNVYDAVPPSEACLYSHINWTLAEANHQSSLGLFQSLAFMRCARAMPDARLMFNIQKQLVLVSYVAF